DVCRVMCGRGGGWGPGSGAGLGRVPLTGACRVPPAPTRAAAAARLPAVGVAGSERGCGGGDVGAVWTGVSTNGLT
ncbi:hypothetical protein, partial [Streptomyces sp. MB09-02B]|uniref:hypothetical protein n=1 Tax=Streptomyces sp. MB09-02B TaxID=3028667 RepID=UPI0029BEF212|nr:hypothetical protein [Streptomyces sp. MB09-02B]